MGKPLGNYITIGRRILWTERKRLTETVKAITSELSKLVRFHNKLNVSHRFGQRDGHPGFIGTLHCFQGQVTPHVCNHELKATRMWAV